MAGTTEQGTKPPGHPDVRRRRTAEERLQAILRLLRMADERGNVSVACSIVGYSRSTFYRLRTFVRSHGEAGLLDALEGRARATQVRDDEIGRISLLHPTMSREAVARYLRAHGVYVSPATVRRTWLRLALQTRAERERAGNARGRLRPHSRPGNCPTR